MTTRNLDVAPLPDHGTGSRTPLWWGTAGFIAIEAMIFGTLIVTYLYGMARADTWPPGGEPPRLIHGAVISGILLLSLWPNTLYQRATQRADAPAVRRWLIVAVVLETALLVVRGFEFTALQVRWDEHFYGSILWTLLGFHTLHLVSDWVETAVLLAISFRQPLTPRRCADFGENAAYWYFAVIFWVPLFVLIYLVPRLSA